MAETVNEPDENLNKRRNGLMLKVALLVALTAFLVTLYWFVYIRGIESTDDAYVGGNLINVYPRVSGKAIAYYCDDTDLVEQGQLLVELDPIDFELSFQKTKEELALAVRNVVELQAVVEQKRAKVQMAKAKLDKAKYDFENRNMLAGSSAVSKEDLEHANTELKSMDAALKQSSYELAEKEAALGTTSLREHPSVVKAKAALREAYVHLKRTKVLAPVTGYVAKRNVQPGSAVSPSTPLMAIIPLNTVWVDANFKEVQIANMRIGQKATVTVDAYGKSVPYEGRVVGLEPGTGSVFSLLPPQNAVGNWIKIVQRVTVRIALDAEQVKKNPLLLGLSVYARVNTLDTEGKFLADVPSTAIVSRTPVYEIPMEEADKLIDQIIKNNE